MSRASGRSSPAHALVRVAERLRRRVGELRFQAPVAFVYNPLEYAWSAARLYLQRYGDGAGRNLLLGMNPGPWGMAQTGVPFGDVGMVRDWLGIAAPVERPADEHPKRPVLGFDCPRSEVSGARLWGWARDRFRSPDRFFESFFVANYCPLAFLDSGGRNLTPDRLPSGQTAELFAACDQALVELVSALAPARVIGVGGFAESRARRVLTGIDVPIGRVLHPSPASPLANRGWAERAERDLEEQGVRLPLRKKRRGSG